jgi:hypothetical protein
MLMRNNLKPEIHAEVFVDGRLPIRVTYSD